MSDPVPLSKSADAFRQLIAMRNSGDEPDPFSLARFEKAARASMEVDPVGAHQLLGVIAACRWDAAGVRENFDASIAAGGGHVAVANYGRALREVNVLDEAYGKMIDAVSLAPEMLAYLREAIGSSFIAGDWSATLDLYATLEARSIEIPADMRSAKEFVVFSMRLGVRSETVQKVMGVAAAYLAENRIRISGVRDVSDNHPGEECSYFEMHLRATPERVKELDVGLTPLLFDQVPDLQLDVFSLLLEAQANVA